MIERKRTFCPFCSLACPYEAQSQDGDPLGLEYDANHPVTAGALCAKGNATFALLGLPGRIDAPLVGGKPTRWPEALSVLADEIERKPKGSVGLILGADATAEEARLAGQFAARCLGGAPSALGFAANEQAVLAEAAAEPSVPEAMFADVAKANVVVAVGDLFSLCPVFSRRVLDAKYGARGNALVSVGRDEGLTARLASMKVTAASERRAALSLLSALGGSTLPPAVRNLPPAVESAAAARVLAGAARVVVLAASVDPVAVRLAKLIAAALGGKASFAAMVEAAAAKDLLDNWRPETDICGVLRAVKEGQLQGLLALGFDILAASDAAAGAMDQLPLLAAGSAFNCRTTKAARFVLPTLLWAEKSGTMAGARREPAISGVGLAQGYGWILEGLARELGAELGGSPVLAAARPLSLEAVFGQAVQDAAAPRGAFTAREAADPMTRAALTGAFVA